MPQEKDLELEYTHFFKVHVPNLLNETFTAAVRPEDLQALRIPLNTFVKYIYSVAERCAEINDPILNRLMVEMALYEVGDPQSKNYDPKKIAEIIKKTKNVKSKTN